MLGGAAAQLAGCPQRSGATKRLAVLKHATKTGLAVKAAVKKAEEVGLFERMKRAQQEFQHDLSKVQAKLDLLASTQRKIITPNSPFCRRWDLLMMIAILIAGTVSLIIAFSSISSFSPPFSSSA